MITKVRLQGAVYGSIWQPGCGICWKEFRKDDAHGAGWKGPRPTARDMALSAVGDGDFQDCKLTADSEFRFERLYSDGHIAIRFVPVTAFPSIADMIGDLQTPELYSEDV